MGKNPDPGSEVRNKHIRNPEYNKYEDIIFYLDFKMQFFRSKSFILKIIPAPKYQFFSDIKSFLFKCKKNTYKLAYLYTGVTCFSCFCVRYRFYLMVRLDGTVSRTNSSFPRVLIDCGYFCCRVPPLEAGPASPSPSTRRPVPRRSSSTCPLQLQFWYPTTRSPSSGRERRAKDLNSSRALTAATRRAAAAALLKGRPLGRPRR